ncbi:hypothetical protein DFR29_10333 [Tahibacter aquaticus]|uniref:Uncharacterized protein n=1 Tax=Tahibacter aquaticus TaxID=520092 RepID=A0A4R6Z4B7_9GAMM|nr:DUF6249 domain-containing protein [Tahibacter aquaticus]TDR46502.1 hypothetical protein DFR29_10333 [Tahibacter aquaticus]
MEHQDLVPIVLFGCITYVIKLIVEARMRVLLLRAGGSDELLRSLLDSDVSRRRHSSLRSGITLVAVALGFAFIQGRGWDEINAGTIAILAGAVGLGNLAYFLVSQRLR